MHYASDDDGWGDTGEILDFVLKLAVWCEFRYVEPVRIDGSRDFSMGASPSLWKAILVCFLHLEQSHHSVCSVSLEVLMFSLLHCLLSFGFLLSAFCLSNLLQQRKSWWGSVFSLWVVNWFPHHAHAHK